MDLFQVLKNHISCHPARLESLYHMILGLCLYQSVHLRQLSYNLPGLSSIDSKIRRVQRFFQHQIMDYVGVGKVVLSLFKLPQKLTITLDRTDWMLGKTSINILVLGVLVGEMSIPLVFINLNKQGNSNTKERTRLIQRLLRIIPAHRIDCLLADREFIGQEWFQLLITKGIPFAIRIKRSTKMRDPRTGKMVTVQQYYQAVRPGSYVIKTRIWNQDVCLMFWKKSQIMDKALLLAVSSPDIHKSWVKKYRQRWSIERMFLSMKTHGFNLEQTHLTDPKRLDKLVAVMAIAFAVCCKKGKLMNEKIPIKIKNHGRKLYSIFTYGLYGIKEKISQTIEYKQIQEFL